MSNDGKKIALRKGKTEQSLFRRGKGMAGLTCVYLTFTLNAIILCAYIHRSEIASEDTVDIHKQYNVHGSNVVVGFLH